MPYFWKKYKNSEYTILTTIPMIEIITPASAVRLFSVLKLNKPNVMPSTLATPPHNGTIARHKLITPNEADASDKNFAVRNSGSRLLGSTSMQNLQKNYTRTEIALISLSVVLLQQ